MKARYLLPFVLVLASAGLALAQDDNEARPRRRIGDPSVCVCSCLFFIVAIIGSFVVIKYFIADYSKGAPRTEATTEEMAAELDLKREVLYKTEKVPEWKTSERSKATKAILKFLGYTDSWFDSKYLTEVADEAFRLVKESIADRSLEGVERRVTPEYLEELRGEIKQLKREREVRVFDKILVPTVQLVHVEAPPGKPNHTFTALITGKSRDFVEDDETGEIIRGDKRVYLNQEFWTFRRSEKRWLVELVRPSADVDAVLEAKSVLAAIDLEEFAKDADPAYLKHVTAR